MSSYNLNKKPHDTIVRQRGRSTNFTATLKVSCNKRLKFFSFLAYKISSPARLNFLSYLSNLQPISYSSKTTQQFSSKDHLQVSLAFVLQC